MFSVYNLFFTSLPILAFGVLDQDFSADQLQREMHRYKRFAGNAMMSWGQFFKWNLLGNDESEANIVKSNNLVFFVVVLITLGLYHSSVIFFGTVLFFYYELDVFPNGQTLDSVSFGTLVCQGLVVVANIKVFVCLYPSLFAYSLKRNSSIIRQFFTRSFFSGVEQLLIESCYWTLPFGLSVAFSNIIAFRCFLFLYCGVYM
jgi:magnesium-transporting ATPase (P-type)